MLAAFDESTVRLFASRRPTTEIYTSTQIWEFEREAIFGNDWLCVGRADQVPEPGDFRTISVIDEPLILTRDREGELRVLSAVCQHRGMVVAEGAGTCSKFTCRSEGHKSELQSLMRRSYADFCLKKK